MIKTTIRRRERILHNSALKRKKGLDLIASNDCLSCHRVSDYYQGPAYEAIAERYPDDSKVIDTLAGKIITGGTGRWGTIPMTPHPALSMDDARTMVKYVLSLK